MSIAVTDTTILMNIEHFSLCVYICTVYKTLIAERIKEENMKIMELTN